MTNKPRIIVFDLETLPNMKEAMKVWPRLSAYPGLTMKATITTIICAGRKVLGEKKTHCINAWDFSRWTRNINDDYSVVKGLHAVLKDADAVITHNGKRFDWKFLQTRILHHGLAPLPSIRHIDTVLTARSHLLSFNNRLGTLGDFLVNEKKLKHTGWDLWVDVSNKDAKAMKLMTAYCKQDVNLLEKIFNRLRPFIKDLPNRNMTNPESRSCPSCGDGRLQSFGVRTTATKSYRRYRCASCGAYCRTDSLDKMPRAI